MPYCTSFARNAQIRFAFRIAGVRPLRGLAFFIFRLNSYRLTIHLHLWLAHDVNSSCSPDGAVSVNVTQRDEAPNVCSASPCCAGLVT